MNKPSPSFESRFDHTLATRQAELEAALNALTAGGAAVERDGEREVEDFKDLASREAESSMTAHEFTRLTAELTQVAMARRRISEHHYGRCVECREPIDLRRLEALPATPFCVACQALHEKTRPLAASQM